MGAAGQVNAVVESDAGLVLDNAVHCHWKEKEVLIRLKNENTEGKT